MKKKIGLLIVSICLFGSLILLLWGIRMKKTVSAAILTTQKQEAQEAELDFTGTLEFSLLYKKESIPYEKKEGVYYLPLSADKNWLWEESFSLAEEGLQLYWYEDPYWKQPKKAVAEGHGFTFLVTDGTKASKGTLIFTGLPIICLETEDTLEEESYFCQVQVLDPFHNSAGLYEITQCFGTINLRGRSSKSFPKKGWELNLTDENGVPYKTKLLGLREDDDWKLNALYPDATKVREQICFELWNELAARTQSPYDAGTHMEYFELIWNGEYLGLYGAMEQIDYKQLSLDKEEDILYKAYAWPLESYPDQYAPEKEEYGHLIKEGDREITEELWGPLKEYVLAANYTSENENWDADVFYQYLLTHMDQDNFINIELYIQTLYACDNKYKNLYVAADLREDGGYTLWRIPWDLNYSFGDRFSVENSALTSFQLEWAERLMPEFMMSETLLEAGNEAFIKQLNLKWEELKNGIFSPENVEKIARENMDLLVDSGAFARDAARWPEGPHDASVEDLLQFYNCRLAFLDAHYRSYLNEK